MSAIHMQCTRCKGFFIVGMVGTWVWPAHVCPDGTKGAPSVYAPWPPTTQEEGK